MPNYSSNNNINKNNNNNNNFYASDQMATLKSIHSLNRYQSEQQQQSDFPRCSNNQNSSFNDKMLFALSSNKPSTSSGSSFACLNDRFQNSVISDLLQQHQTNSNFNGSNPYANTHHYLLGEHGAANLLQNALNLNKQFNLNISNNSNQPADESKCHVCGDKSTGSHFGGISCESCKAFFRRSVQRNRFEDYKCSYSGECKMNTNTRKICQYCRYKRCLLIGMKPKWVLSDDERQQKYGNRRKNKLKPDETSQTSASTSTNNNVELNKTVTESNNSKEGDESSSIKKGSSTPSSINSGEDGEESSFSAKRQLEDDSETGEKEFDKNDINKFGIDGINMSSTQLDTYEKYLIDRLSIAFYHSRKHNSIDLNVQKKLGLLFQTQNQESLKKLSKVILANFIVQPVKRVITFAKLIPDFRKLDIKDQMNLLQGGSMEIFICSSASLYDAISNKFVNLVSKDRNITGNDSSNIQLDILRLIWTEEIFDRTISFLKSMSELKIDEATLILFLPLILFSPDRLGLNDQKQISNIQSKYSFLLKKYILWKYGRNAFSTKLYHTLLLKLIELRTLHEMHSSVLLDADPTQLEPFPLALILNEKTNKNKDTNSQAQSPSHPPTNINNQEISEADTSNLDTQTNTNNANSPLDINNQVQESTSIVTSNEPELINDNNNNHTNINDDNNKNTVLNKNHSGSTISSYFSVLTPLSLSSSSGYSTNGQISSISSASPNSSHLSPILNDGNLSSL